MFAYNRGVSVRRFFPDPRDDYAEGLVAISEHLTLEMLIEAYEWGIFPWPGEETPILWFCPDPRGVLDFDQLHVPQSFKKFLKKCSWTVSHNLAFAQVIQQCADQPRAAQTSTWITPVMQAAYIKFHEHGYAHSFEVWDKDMLVGGLYGVWFNGCFSAESMFHAKSNASKVALWSCIQWLKSNHVKWMDIQMVTPLLRSWGGREISKREYFRRLGMLRVDNT